MLESNITKAGDRKKDGSGFESSLVAQMVKNLPAKWETWVLSLGWEAQGSDMTKHSISAKTSSESVPQTYPSSPKVCSHLFYYYFNFMKRTYHKIYFLRRFLGVSHSVVSEYL